MNIVSAKSVQFSILFLLAAGCVAAEVITVEPRGEFARIDTTKSIAAIEAIQRRKSDVIAQVKSDPGSFQPPVLYALAGELFRQGKRDDAMYWFYLGQLRARSDANKALDPSAAAGVDVLNESYGPPINKYAFKNIPKLKETVERVVADDASLPRNYDPRWIALHGMDAFVEEKLRFSPKAKWKSINEKTRKDYMAGFQEMLKSIE